MFKQEICIRILITRDYRKKILGNVMYEPSKLIPFVIKSDRLANLVSLFIVIVLRPTWKLFNNHISSQNHYIKILRKETNRRLKLLAYEVV